MGESSIAALRAVRGEDSLTSLRVGSCEEHHDIVQAALHIDPCYAGSTLLATHLDKVVVEHQGAVYTVPVTSKDPYKFGQPLEEARYDLASEIVATATAAAESILRGDALSAAAMVSAIAEAVSDGVPSGASALAVQERPWWDHVLALRGVAPVVEGTARSACADIGLMLERHADTLQEASERDMALAVARYAGLVVESGAAGDDVAAYLGRAVAWLQSFNSLGG